MLGTIVVTLLVCLILYSMGITAILGVILYYQDRAKYLGHAVPRPIALVSKYIKI